MPPAGLPSMTLITAGAPPDAELPAWAVEPRVGPPLLDLSLLLLPPLKTTNRITIAASAPTATAMRLRFERIETSLTRGGPPPAPPSPARQTSSGGGLRARPKASAAQA